MQSIPWELFDCVIAKPCQHQHAQCIPWELFDCMIAEPCQHTHAQHRHAMREPAQGVQRCCKIRQRGMHESTTAWFIPGSFWAHSGLIPGSFWVHTGLILTTLSFQLCALTGTLLTCCALVLQLALQLQHLLQEKSKLQQEKERLAYENSNLVQLLDFACANMDGGDEGNEGAS